MISSLRRSPCRPRPRRLWRVCTLQRRRPRLLAPGRVAWPVPSRGQARLYAQSMQAGRGQEHGTTSSRGSAPRAWRGGRRRDGAGRLLLRQDGAPARQSHATDGTWRGRWRRLRQRGRLPSRCVRQIWQLRWTRPRSFCIITTGWCWCHSTHGANDTRGRPPVPGG